MRTTKRIAALITLAAFTQTACYNTYFISKDELRKLESSVEQEEVVTVYGDCPGGASASLDVDRPLYAQAGEEAGGEDAEAASGEETATDAPAETPPAETATEAAPAESTEAPAAETVAEGEGEAAPASTSGCTEVKVSTNNSLSIIGEDGSEQRVTPFNFIMSAGQLVSPEYNLLESLNDIQGAEVSEFSTWKTVGTIVGVSVVAVGTFAAVSLLASESTGFEN